MSALTSYQFAPDHIPNLVSGGVHVHVHVCGLSLLLVFIPAIRVFFQFLCFCSLHKNYTSTGMPLQVAIIICISCKLYMYYSKTC